MKYLQGLIMLVLLLTSARYRQAIREATERLSEALDEVEASERRTRAMRNGGRPDLHVLAGGGMFPQRTS